MKSRPVYEINALSSILLGFTGMGLLLTPERLQGILGGLPIWMPAALGILCYILALSNQMLFAFEMPFRREVFIRVSATALLLILGGIYARTGFYVESLLFIFIGAAQSISITPLWIKKYSTHDLLNILAIVTNTLCGILLLSLTFYPGQAYIRLLPYHNLLAGSFFFFAWLGTISIYNPKIKFYDLITRLAALPWLAWCIIFLLPLSAPNMIGPSIFAFHILLSGMIPWQRFMLPEEDVLGHRVIITVSTVQLITLIFLSALLERTNPLILKTAGLDISMRDTAFVFFCILSVVMAYGVSTILMSINGLMTELTETEAEHPLPNRAGRLVTWNERLARYLKPFAQTRQGMRLRLVSQADQINILSRQVVLEKHRNAQFILLSELSQQLENQLDQPVSAQLAVNTLERALGCSLACLYIHEADQHEFMLLAAAGRRTDLAPAGYRQSTSSGVIGRAMRQRKTQIVNDIRSDSDYIKFENETHLSAVVVPLIFNGHVNGCIVVNSEKVNAFSSIDVNLVEAAAAELTRAWERSGYQRRLTELIQSGSSLSTMVEPEETAREIASIAAQTLQARFTFVQIQLGQEGDFLENASSGNAPRLLESLHHESETDKLIQAAFHAAQPFRVRDVRKYASTTHLNIDHNNLRSMLAVPIRWHRLSIGAILAFGKQNEIFFTENDESLAELLAIQAASAFESVWLQKELRASLNTTSLLYRLSNQIIQEDEMQGAALDIAQTAHKLGKGISTGIVLFNADGKIEAEVEVDAGGAHGGLDHPMETIQQVMQSGQLIYLSQGHSITRVCLPIQTPIRKYGALWINIPEDRNHKPASPADLQTLVNQAAIALERSILLVESRHQAREIKNAFDTLEATYDQTLASLMSALDARDRETEGHSLRVSRLSEKLGEMLGLSQQELKALERGSLLHDIGKIGVSDIILHKPSALDENEWKLMRLHPDIGAHIVEGIPFLQETLPVIRYHQERWDGSGYPLGLSGEEIPLLARLFAVVDAFDALTSKRPYRQKISPVEAFKFLRAQSGVLFDPLIVNAFEHLVMNGQASDLLGYD